MRLTKRRPVSRARRRLRRLGSADILDWCDQAGSGVFHALDEYRRKSTEDSLLEAEMGLKALLDAVQELLDRRQ